MVEELPEGLSRPLAGVPFSLRLGMGYSRAARQIRHADTCESSQRLATSFQQLRAIVQYAYDKVPYYRERYQSAGFSPADLRDPVDWERIPVITKDDLQSISFAERCNLGVRGIRVNTGGTSGQPLEFLLDDQAFAREWAHMHYIWRARGYDPSHLKLTFRGKHYDPCIPFRYNAVHNEYIVNSNCPLEHLARALEELPSSRLIRWLHGYPSLVAEFAGVIEDGFPALAESLRNQLFGILLGSEYPTLFYRNRIERVLSSNIVSWYGHSEMAILARETAIGAYQSLPTYGYAEAVPVIDGEHRSARLICTSFYNRAHPFIRYDTGDLVEPLSNSGASLAFRVVEGRVGDFVIDRKGMKLALTAIIFGRHHKAFEQVRHIQVRQTELGRVTFLVTPRTKHTDAIKIREGLDLDDLDLDWDIEMLDEPVRTSAGKIRLKIGSETSLIA